VEEVDDCAWYYHDDTDTERLTMFAVYRLSATVVTCAKGTRTASGAWPSECQGGLLRCPPGQP
jgi:hypothetical protein